MIKKNKKLFADILLTTILIIVARALRLMINDMDSLLLSTLLIYLRGAIHLCLAIVWTVSVYNRITNKQARKFVLIVGMLMLFWIVAKMAKWEFFPNNTDTLVRYLWYAFYIPMLLIPLIGIFVTQYIRKPDGYRLPKWSYLFFIPAFLLLVGIFTNDLHNLMFAFPKGIEYFDSNYTYGILYWISMAWYVSLTLAFVIILICKSRLPGSKRVQKIPLVVAIVAIAFWILYTAGLINGDLTVIDCIIIGTLLETAIQTGLIPTNTSHKELFVETTVPVIIIDEDYQARYTSGGALPVSEKAMRASADAPVSLGDTVLCSAPITAGRVVWQNDVAELNRQREDLDDVRERLAEEVDLIQAENEIKERQAKADEPTTALDVATQSHILDLLENQKKRGLSTLFITHDLGIVSKIADRVAVVYAGIVVETGTKTQIFDSPMHPYTQLLVSLTQISNRHRKDILPTICGSFPSVNEKIHRCPFADCCEYTMPKCYDSIPSCYKMPDGHSVSCSLYEI